ncbi:MAG: EamA family transporter [Oscillospiraceae bacterium]|nr:EamA family transporter [Oscillospiraceae bacterium]
MDQKTIAMGKVRVIGSMAIFGTIGLFVRFIPMPSSVIACCRGAIGTVFLLLLCLLTGVKLSGKAIRRNLKLLLICGAAMGFNWILLFESYRYTTVATATICYYLAPVFVIILSPFVRKEKLTPVRALCALVALLGMIPLSGVLGGEIRGARGILFALGAAVLYASIVMMNQFMKDISSYETTIMQLFFSHVVLLPYVLLTEDVAAAFSVGALDIGVLLFVGIVHTGIAYWMYFGGIPHISVQTAAIFSYLDPVVAIILSAVVLREEMGLWSIVGAVAILGATLVSELCGNGKKE